MTTDEIFAKISQHQEIGIGLHFDMCDYFDFLNLHGFKRQQEYQYFAENASRRGLHRYYINHYQKALKTNSEDFIAVIPISWFNYKRDDVDPNTLKKAAKEGFDTWIKWETETKKFYENMYIELTKINEIASAIKVKELIKDVDEELKYAYRLNLELKSIDYNIIYIFDIQNSLHEKYKEKTKEIGVNIC